MTTPQLPQVFTPPAEPPDEANRLAALRALEVLDTDPQPELDALVKAASLVCEVPISLVSLVDARRQWFKANVGLNATETPRDISFCGHAILGQDVFEVDDTAADLRFAGNPLVTGQPEIRFYAGAPIRLSDGSAVGTLCVIDRKPHHLNPAQRAVLQQLATVAASLLERAWQLQQVAQWKQAAQQSNRMNERLAGIVEQSEDAIISTGVDAQVTSWNKAAERLFGYAAQEMLGQPVERLFPADLAEQARSLLRRVSAGEAISNFETERCHRDGRRIHVSISMAPLVADDGTVAGASKIVRDISARIAAEAALRSSETQYGTLIAALYEGVVVQTVDGAITSCNASALRLLGLDREQLLGRRSIDPSWRCVREDLSDWPGSTHPSMQALATGQEVRDAVMGVYRPDAELVWISINAKPMFENGQARPTSVITTFAEITERKRAVDSLRQSQRMFSAMFESAATGMGILSPNGVWQQTNRALQKFLGYETEELLEFSFADVSHPDEWEADAAQLASLLAGEVESISRTKRYIHREGHAVWGLMSASVVRDALERPEFMVTQIIDLTARKRAEESLAASNALMEESQAVARVGGWSLDVDSGNLTWTMETYRIHDTTPEAFDPVVDQAVQYFVPASRMLIEHALHEAMADQKPYDLELQTYTTKGRLIDVRTTGTPEVRNGRVVRLSGIFQDITERKHVEQALHEARQAAEDAAASKGQFLANMSHEIRTPMNAILGLLNLLQTTELTKRQLDYASKTQGAAESLLGLLNDILDFSKVEAGKMTLEQEPMRLDHLLRNISVVLSANVGAKDIEVLFDVDPDLPEVVRGDALRLQQILINLGGNAVKFTSAGQVVVALHSVHDTPGEGMVTIRFAVQDSGIGIAPENQAHIFTGFSQAEGSTTRRFGGTGLGLAISKRLVEMMGGTLGLESVPGQGSTFSFALQFPAVAEVPPELARPPRPSIAPQSVLVVDDNPIAGELTVRMVRAWGWPVDLATSGEQATLLCGQAGGAACTAFPYPLVFMDWEMPGIDGWETTRRLRALATSWKVPPPTVIMVTAHGRNTLSKRTVEEQEALGGFLVKPVTSSMLLDAYLDARAGKAGSQIVQPGRSSRRQLAGMRVLVVEDNLINQQVAEELLGNEGALVSLAANGRLGVDAVIAAVPPFDVVLMDVQMPVLDGYAATREIRSMAGFARLPIVAMTANAMASDREACLACGMNEHIGKPFDMAQLISLLLRVTGFEAAPGAGNNGAESARRINYPVDGSFNLKVVLDRMGGLEHLFVRTAREFIRQIPAVVPGIEASMLQGDTLQLRRVLHTLKGNAATLGVDALATCAALMERLAADDDAVAQCRRRIPELSSHLTHAGALLGSAVERLEQSGGAPVLALPAAVDTGQALRQLEVLHALAANSNLEVLERFAQARSDLSGLPDGFCDQLENALQSLDMDRVHALCGGMMETLRA